MPVEAVESWKKTRTVLAYSAVAMGACASTPSAARHTPSFSEVGPRDASLSVDIYLWRCSQKRHQQACERRSADAKRSINEGFAGVRKVWGPSS